MTCEPPWHSLSLTWLLHPMLTDQGGTTLLEAVWLLWQDQMCRVWPISESPIKVTSREHHCSVWLANSCPISRSSSQAPFSCLWNHSEPSTFFHPFLSEELEKESPRIETLQEGMAQVPSLLSAPLFFQSTHLPWVNFHGRKGGNLHNLPTAEFGHNCLHFLRCRRLSLLPF